MRPNANSRGLKSKNKQIKKEDDSSGSDNDENLAQEKTSGREKKGFNWTAVILLLMFLVPVVLAGFVQVSGC
jgi:hypothetical protein